MKAKLIKRIEIQKPSNHQTTTKKPELPAKTTAEVVRGWIGEHQNSKQSARQAFTSLFPKQTLRRA